MSERSVVRANVGQESAEAEVTAVQDYLRRFGYLGDVAAAQEAFGALPYPVPEGESLSELTGRSVEVSGGTFDDATERAVALFQEFAGLPATGAVDEQTAEKMNQPRCGVPDFPELGEFVVSGGKWATTNLRYAFQNFTADLTNNEIVVAMEQAFALWAAHTPLRFTRVSFGSPAEIIIRFVSGDHGDGAPFDGSGGTLAHAFFPNSPVTEIHGDAHFDDAETWTVTIPPQGGRFDLVTVAAHEFGHSLGLRHSEVSTALMAPFYGGPHRFLDNDDIAGIRSVYGGFPIEHAAWVHGLDLHVEVESNVESLKRFGFYTRVVGKPNTTNWYHFAIPTPVISKGNRLTFARAMLRLVTGGSNAVVRDVHIYDGSARIAAHNGVNLSGSLPFAVFGIPHKPAVFWGAGISIGVTTGGGSAAARRMDFIGAGIDFLR